LRVKSKFFTNFAPLLLLSPAALPRPVINATYQGSSPEGYTR
jgi:hypothetical protein